ncbi:conserved region in glutamate synthase family protein, partial [Vibrio parahaemolyticus V-223/04]
RRRRMGRSNRRIGG